jgi:hypothetical protein
MSQPQEVTFAFTGTAAELPPSVAAPGAFRRDLTNGAPLLIDRTHQAMQGVNGAAILLGTDEVTSPARQRAGITQYAAVLAEWRPDPSPAGYRRHQEFLLLSLYAKPPCTCCGWRGKVSLVPASQSAQRLPVLVQTLRADDFAALSRAMVRWEPVVQVSWEAGDAREVAALHTALLTASVSGRLRVPTGPTEFAYYAEQVALVVSDTICRERARPGNPRPMPTTAQQEQIDIRITVLEDRPATPLGVGGYGA